MSEEDNVLDSKEVKATISKKSDFEKEVENAVKKVEVKEPVVEKKTTPKATVVEDRVIYSTKTGIIPNFGQINKGYTKLDKNKAKVLVNQYSFIRYASEEEIAIYVN